MRLPVPSGVVQQFVVQFACLTPTLREITPAERKALKDMLSSRADGLFQLFDREASEAPSNLFQAARQYPVGPMTVTVPSLIISHNSVTLLHPIWLGQKAFVSNAKFDSGYLNSEMVKTLFEIQSILTKVKFSRAGKIFELVVGPVPPDRKGKLLSRVFSYTLDEVGEVNLSFTPYRRVEGDIFNFQTKISYQQAELSQAINVALRVDINNRDLKDSMEPTQIQQVWDRADRLIEDYFQQLVEYSEVS